MRLAAVLFAFLLVLPGVVHAADPQDAILQKVGVDEKPGATIPRDLPFADASRREVRLGTISATARSSSPSITTPARCSAPDVRSLAATMSQVKGFSLRGTIAW